MMYEPVTDVCFVDIPWLRIGNIERMIATMPIRTIDNIIVK